MENMRIHRNERIGRFVGKAVEFLCRRYKAVLAFITYITTIIVYNSKSSSSRQNLKGFAINIS